ncbi:hypothetical protein [uncultured Rubinisphaera sp.]|uniref:hypothetical protein n=1 Tax=uncultured Rubinisphaera sp. TaxID=1678686 RepID=UPI0030DBE5A5
MSNENIRAQVDSLSSSPIAFEALWDGDSSGWFIQFAAITADSQTLPLGVVSHGGDIRLFNGQVPPWPEAAAAKLLGNELAELFCAEFYFPSPDHPEDECPSWHDRKQGYPCRRCGILLFQRDDCRWRGICYYCHLDEEREKREAQWTPEQRAGPRCSICGNPATNELADSPVCGDCFANYNIYNCEQCGASWRGHVSYNHSSRCSKCERESLVNSLTASQRDRIRVAMDKHRCDGLDTAMDILNCDLYDAQYVLHVLSPPKPHDTA